MDDAGHKASAAWESCKLLLYHILDLDISVAFAFAGQSRVSRAILCPLYS